MTRIIGTGLYVPGEPIGNTELMELAKIEFDAERLEQKLGISQRHIAHLRGLDETSADFAEKAARAAIADAGVDPMDVDLFVVASDTPEYISPATSMLIQGRIQGGRRNTGTFDLNASCSGFVAAFHTVSNLMASDKNLRHACVVGMYNMPAYIRPGDVFGYSIFADGAAAVVIRRSEQEEESRYLAGQYVADGTQWDYVGVYAGGTRKAVTRELLESGQYGLENLKRLPGDRNVNLWPPVVERLLQNGSQTIADVDHILFTQINRSVILEVMGILGLPEEKTTTVMDRYGYTGSACIPMAFNTAVSEGRIERGQTVALVASGAGLAVASSLFVY